MYDLFGKYGAIRQIRMCVLRRARLQQQLSALPSTCRTPGSPVIATLPHSLPLAHRALCTLYRGNVHDTKGTAFVVYEDIYDAKNAVDHLSGFNVCGRYLIVLYYQPTKMQKKLDEKRKRKELDALKKKWELTSET